MFLGLGLRHLPVLDEDGSVAGLLTRKDLIAHAAWIEWSAELRSFPPNGV
jgi:CBS-domain-containing membrane protein